MWHVYLFRFEAFDTLPLSLIIGSPRSCWGIVLVQDYQVDRSQRVVRPPCMHGEGSTPLGIHGSILAGSASCCSPLHGSLACLCLQMTSRTVHVDW